MTMEEMLNFCKEREVEIRTRYDFISDSFIIKMQKNNFAIGNVVSVEMMISTGFGLIIRVILREMADKLDKYGEEVRALNRGAKVKPGDKVTMNDKYYVSEADKGKVWTVASEPWDCCGTMVVKLEGKSGGYAVDGLSLAKEGKV